MTKDERRLVAVLQKMAMEKDDGCLTPEIIEDISDAADTIVRLSEDLENTRANLEACVVKEIIVDGGGITIRDTQVGWKKRAAAAERDIIELMRANADDIHCDMCAKGSTREACRYYGKGVCKEAKWRGPCAENGGVDDGPD